MAIEKRTCIAHPDRLAIGVCVETKLPICAECSTRYEGVNYSKEGLRRLQERRNGPAKPADPARAVGMKRVARGTLIGALTVFCIWVTFLGYSTLFGGITDILYPQEEQAAEMLKSLQRIFGG